MSESGRETTPGVSKQGSAIRSRSGSRLPLAFLGMLIVGIAGALFFDARWVEGVANHLGGLGVVGLLACLATYVAKKKGRDPGTAFLLGSLLPIILGIIAALLVYFTTGFVYCGGGVILLSAITVIISYSCLRRREIRHA